MSAYLKIHSRREGYAPSQCPSTVTVGKLINCLSHYPKDLKVYLSHDGGYTYGGIDEEDIEQNMEEEEREEEE